MTWRGVGVTKERSSLNEVSLASLFATHSTTGYTEKNGGWLGWAAFVASMKTSR